MKAGHDHQTTVRIRTTSTALAKQAAEDIVRASGYAVIGVVSIDWPLEGLVAVTLNIEPEGFENATE